MLQEKAFEIIKNSDCAAAVEFIKETDGVLFFKFSYKTSKVEVPQKVTVKFSFPSRGTYSFWNPVLLLSRGLAPHCVYNKGAVCESRMAFGAPVQSTILQDGKNNITVALSDAKTPTEIVSVIDESNSNLSFSISFFTIPIGKINSYEAIIRIDTRDVPYFKSITDSAKWWESDCGYAPCAVPSAAKEAIYSSWYTFHQDLHPEELLNQCKIAKSLGMNTIIVDDGWQTDDSAGGYKYCGDWALAPSKIPDMKALVDAVHSVGMKFMLWYSVPFIGKESSLWSKFSDMVLDEGEHGWCCLDPRYKKVRDYLIETYKRGALEWGLDGFKLDFIDSFRLTKISMNDDPRRDFVSLEDAVHKLLIDVTATLREINPDMLFEFRQSYIGPAVRMFGNMIRVNDCPADSLINHNNIADLRLTSGKTAVHGDMLMWDKNASAEIAAKQLIAVLYGVPQISVDLTDIPERHFKMLKFYLDFWNKNRDALIDGKFIPLNPECNYSTFIGKTDAKTVATCYNTNLLSLNELSRETYIVNGTGKCGIVLSLSQCISAAAEIYDCTGELVSTAPIQSLTKLDIPVSGIAKIIC